MRPTTSRFTPLSSACPETSSAAARSAGTVDEAVVLDALSGGTGRKGRTSVSELRGTLAVPADTDQAVYECTGDVRAPRHLVTMTPCEHEETIVRLPVAVEKYPQVDRLRSPVLAS